MNNIALSALVLATTMAAASAAASPWETDNIRLLGDPSFLPEAGQVEGRFGYTYAANLYDYRTAVPAGFFNSGTTASYDRSSQTFSPFLSYGVTDTISLFANMDFGNSRNFEAYTYQRRVRLPEVGGPIGPVAIGPVSIGPILPPPPPVFVTQTVHATAEFRSLGADDPGFGATWRVIDQRTAPVSVDITGSYTPDIFQGRTANDNQTGSFADGGQAGSVQAAVSRQMRLLTLRAYGEFAYSGRRNERDFGASSDLRSAPHATYLAGLQSEIRVLPWLAINAGITAQQAVRYDRFDVFPGGSTSTTIKPAGLLSPYVGAVVPLVDRHVVGEFLYQHDFVGDQTQIGPYQIQTFQHQFSNLFTARVLFAFGGGGRSMPAPASVAAAPPPVPAVDATYLVFFDWDRADLSARARQIVAQAAQAAQHAAATRIEVSGYTDLSGTAAYNMRLSLRRAQTVAAELVRDGVHRDEISVRGLGESTPLVPTAPGVREPQNRRVEIIFR